MSEEFDEESRNTRASPILEEAKRAMFEEALRAMFVEFLRAVSVQDSNMREHKVAASFWHALHHLGDLEPERCPELVAEAFRRCIALAGRGAHPERYRPIDSVISASGKCLAERISGNDTQESLAIGRLLSWMSQYLRERGHV